MRAVSAAVPKHQPRWRWSIGRNLTEQVSLRTSAVSSESIHNSPSSWESGTTTWMPFLEVPVRQRSSIIRQVVETTASTFAFGLRPRTEVHRIDMAGDENVADAEGISPKCSAVTSTGTSACSSPESPASHPASVKRRGYSFPPAAGIDQSVWRDPRTAASQRPAI